MEAEAENKKRATKILDRMVDVVDSATRSRMMAAVRTRHTTPELAVRSLLHAAGYRFTVNGPRNRALPGKPDIVLPRLRVVIFVNGCFWHRHAGCSRATTPTTRSDFWERKFAANVLRDRRNKRELRALEWSVSDVWECETLPPLRVALERKLRNALDDGRVRLSTAR